MKVNNFRQLQKTLGENRPREGTLYINDARFTIDNWTIRQERIYIYYKCKYLFTIENFDGSNVKYEFSI